MTETYDFHLNGMTRPPSFRSRRSGSGTTTCDDDEIARQMAEFQAHGVDAFVIHPRVGLPRSWAG